VGWRLNVETRANHNQGVNRCGPCPDDTTTRDATAVKCRLHHSTTLRLPVRFVKLRTMSQLPSCIPLHMLI